MTAKEEGERPVRARISVRDAGAYVALVIVAAIFAILQPTFRQPSNLLNVLDQSVEISVVAVGMTAVIILGGIDLAVGSVAALAAFAGAWFVTAHPGGHPLPGGALVGIGIALAIGAAAGLVNGTAVTRLALPPFIATLGMMSIARGLALVWSKGTGVSSGIPPGYLITGERLASFPAGDGRTVVFTYGLPLMLFMFVGGHILLTRTALGRAIFAIGGNEQGARLSGIPVDRVKLLVYAGMGVLAAVGGLIEAGTVGAAVPEAGTELELNAIAAAVIGGASLSGGRGSLAGTFAGALLMRLIRNGLTLVQVDSNWQRVAIGAIIMGAVAFDGIQKRRLTRS